MKPRLLIALGILAVTAVPAFAATDHNFTLSAGTPAFEWEGAPDVSHGAPVFNEDARTATPCDAGPARPCENVLFKVTEAGKFTASVEGLEGTGGTTDVDAYLYKSDESGAPGEKLGSAAASGPDSVTFAKATPGYYLLQVDYYHSYNSGYKGKVKFTSSAPAAAPAPPATTPAPPAAPAEPAAAPPTPAGTAKPYGKKTSKKAACQKKAKKIKNKKKRAKALKKCKKVKG
jgi:hypothetical protein